mmetsp:Transcript_1478/g.4183  ORF Transcript_1478/g.4183 Transcript_1478/m.4183 type:complete len:237 (+) Transcript_1478:110-820(+)
MRDTMRKALLQRTPRSRPPRAERTKPSRSDSTAWSSFRRCPRPSKPSSMPWQQRRNNGTRRSLRCSRGRMWTRSCWPAPRVASPESSPPLCRWRTSPGGARRSPSSRSRISSARCPCCRPWTWTPRRPPRQASRRRRARRRRLRSGREAQAPAEDEAVRGRCCSGAMVLELPRRALRRAAALVRTTRRRASPPDGCGASSRPWGAAPAPPRVGSGGPTPSPTCRRSRRPPPGSPPA